MARLEAVARRRGRALAVTAAALLALSAALALGVDVRQQLAACQAKLVESRQAHSALARAGRDAAVAPAAAAPRRADPSASRAATAS